MKNQQIDEFELLDIGYPDYPNLIITDEVLMDLEKKGVNAK